MEKGWRKILKNKARLTLQFDDILNNEDGRWSQQSAYQQTTSWHDFRHHYRFTYHLNSNGIFHFFLIHFPKAFVQRGLRMLSRYKGTNKS